MIRRTVAVRLACDRADGRRQCRTWRVFVAATFAQARADAEARGWFVHDGRALCPRHHPTKPTTSTTGRR